MGKPPPIQKKRGAVVVNVNTLRGEPSDGTGRICIHLFVRDDHGSFVEPHVLRAATDDSGVAVRGRLAAGPQRGRLACDPKRDVAPVTRGDVMTVTPRTDDPRAVTCPKCMASIDYTEMMKCLVQQALGH